MSWEDRKIIAIDFDGTIVEDEWPEIGNIKHRVVEQMIKEEEKGTYIIIWTCRSGEEIQEMQNWLDEQCIPYDRINANAPWILDAQEAEKTMDNGSDDVFEPPGEEDEKNNDEPEGLNAIVLPGQMIRQEPCQNAGPVQRGHGESVQHPENGVDNYQHNEEKADSAVLGNSEEFVKKDAHGGEREVRERPGSAHQHHTLFRVPEIDRIYRDRFSPAEYNVSGE